jgi:hypothetical protein
MKTGEKLGDLKPNDPSLIREEFAVHKLNERGLDKANELAAAFSELLNNVENEVVPLGNPSRTRRPGAGALPDTPGAGGVLR